MEVPHELPGGLEQIAGEMDKTIDMVRGSPLKSLLLEQVLTRIGIWSRRLREAKVALKEVPNWG